MTTELWGDRSRVSVATSQMHLLAMKSLYARLVVALLSTVREWSQLEMLKTPRARQRDLV